MPWVAWGQKLCGCLPGEGCLCPPNSGQKFVDESAAPRDKGHDSESASGQGPRDESAYDSESLDSLQVQPGSPLEVEETEETEETEESYAMLCKESCTRASCNGECSLKAMKAMKSSRSPKAAKAMEGITKVMTGKGNSIVPVMKVMKGSRAPKAAKAMKAMKVCKLLGSGSSACGSEGGEGA